MRFMGSVGLENTALQSDGQSIRSSNWQPATGHNGKLEIWLPFAAPQSIALDWDNSIGPIRPIRPRTDLHPVDPTSRLHIICVERAPSNMCIFVYVKIYGSHNGFSLHLHLHNTCDGALLHSTLNAFDDLIKLNWNVNSDTAWAGKWRGRTKRHGRKRKTIGELQLQNSRCYNGPRKQGRGL